MAAALWMLLFLCPFMAQCQSGDNDPDREDFDCESLLTINHNTLICYLVEEDPEFATLCTDNETPVCVNGSLDQKKFTFQNLEIFQDYKLQVYFKGDTQVEDIKMKKRVKLDAPLISAKYDNGEAVINIKHDHDYVKQPEFQVEIWGASTNYKEILNVNYSTVTIGGDRFKNGEVYKERVRARPVNYFGGQWSKWSAVTNFTVHTAGTDAESFPSLFYILFFMSPFVLLLLGFVIFRRWNQLQAYLFPVIPHPKATLAQIHKEKISTLQIIIEDVRTLKELVWNYVHSPVSFSPEIFKDSNIYPVDYAEEKPIGPESSESHCDFSKSCYKDNEGSRPLVLFEKEDSDEQRLEDDMSHLRIKLLDECTTAEENKPNTDCQRVAAVQGYAKDETYVTMSSLYKTQ